MLQPVTSILKPAVNIADESFDFSDAHRCRLFMEITDENIAILVLNNSTNKFILLKDYLFSAGETIQKLREIIDGEEFLTKSKYKSVTVSLSTSKTIMVPSAFYHAGDIR